MTNAIAAIRNIYSLPEVNAVAAFSPAGATTSTPPLNQPAFYNWQTLINPRQAMSSALVGQPQQQPALPAILPQVQAGATTNGASAELNQLLNSTNSLTGDVVNQATQRDLAQKQVEQQKALQQQQQVQVNQLKQQNAMLAQQINALQQQQQQTLNPASLTVPLVNGGVASSNPYLVGLGSLGSVPSTATMPSLYSSTFSTAGMGVATTPAPAPQSTVPSPTNATVSTPTPTAITADVQQAKTTPPPSPTKSIATIEETKKTTSTKTSTSAESPKETSSSKEAPAQMVYLRKKGTVEGTLQVKNAKGNILMSLDARSGKEGYTETDWERSKSPIPFSPKEDDYYLNLEPIEDGSVFAAETGKTGRFFPISSNESDTVTIAQEGKERSDIGLHTEDSEKGSKGCVVLLWDTPDRKKQVEDLYAKLGQLGKKQKNIRLSVVSL
jgi:hypothetical protein